MGKKIIQNVFSNSTFFWVNSPHFHLVSFTVLENKNIQVMTTITMGEPSDKTNSKPAKIFHLDSMIRSPFATKIYGAVTYLQVLFISKLYPSSFWSNIVIFWRRIQHQIIFVSELLISHPRSHVVDTLMLISKFVVWEGRVVDCRIATQVDQHIFFREKV